MRPSWFGSVLVAALLVGVAAPAPAVDRLERFRAVARERLAVAVDGAERERAVGELYEVVDAEVLDSLRGDEPFSSLGFIRERLDAMMESWGGATLRVLRIPAASGRVPLTLGLYSLTGVEGSGSLRVYAGTGPGAALAASSTQDGLLDARVWPAGPDRVARVLAVRYEPRYPGWKPGCADQFEHEDHYRLAAAGGLALARRQISNGWHRELGAAAARFFRALAEDDARALGLLVPAPALRARLPRHLVAEPVCEQAGPAGPRGPVTVAATELRAGRRVPWAL